jgi:hypothetical protein
MVLLPALFIVFQKRLFPDKDVEMVGTKEEVVNS